MIQGVAGPDWCINSVQDPAGIERKFPAVLKVTC